MFDRETGKPKGYGFCEYKDQETALSAMRNLDGYEIAGRKLRVDNACTEKSRMEMQNLLAEPVAESPFGPPCEPGRAPEAISKAVASLPPEQMFQLMQQMKLCIQNNPQEARTMLLQNPQLAYALLQAQVVMKIVEPETAVQMLHKSPPAVAPVGAADPSAGRPPGALSFGAPPGTFPMPPGPAGAMADFGMPRPAGLNGPPGGRGMDRPGYPGMDMDQGVKQEPGMRRDPRSRDPRDRGGSAGPGPRPPGGMRGPGGPPPAARPPPQLPAHLAGADPEKAQLIMQVLQLTDEQIAVLPAEQRNSIMVLKEQINQNPGR